jgi:hypothetical protein
MPSHAVGLSQVRSPGNRHVPLMVGEELRKKKPEHFVDERSLADLHASLEHAAWILEQKTAKG